MKLARILLNASMPLVAVVVLALSSTGCTHVRPWERGKLAHPTMLGANLPSPAEEHVYSVQEGAVGGGAGGESGCGCN
jgi:hypothetical protein